MLPSTIRAPHIGIPRVHPPRGQVVHRQRRGEHASDLGASSMCQVTISGAGRPRAGGRAVKGTPAAAP
jgi:hypothetical protein